MFAVSFMFYVVLILCSISLISPRFPLELREQERSSGVQLEPICFHFLSLSQFFSSLPSFQLQLVSLFSPLSFSDFLPLSPKLPAMAYKRTHCILPFYSIPAAQSEMRTTIVAAIPILIKEPHFSDVALIELDEKKVVLDLREIPRHFQENQRGTKERDRERRENRCIQVNVLTHFYYCCYCSFHSATVGWFFPG